MLIMMFWLTMMVTMKLEHAPMFPLLSHDDARINCELHFLPRTSPAVFMTNGWMNGRVQCRGHSCRLHAECFKRIATADLPDMLRNVSKYSMKYPTSLSEAMVVLSLYRKRQIEYTQYVGNNVYVDDVDDDEAGAGAYFLLLRHIDADVNCELH